METITLNTVAIGNLCYIYDIEDKDLRTIQRLYELGLVKGTAIYPLYENMSKSSKAYLVHGCILAIRNIDADKILVTLDNSDGGHYAQHS